MDKKIRPIDLCDMGDMLNLLSLQMAAYKEEAEMIGLTDIPPLLESPGSIRDSGESFYGLFDEGEELAGAISTIDTSENCAIRRLMVRPDRFRQGIGTRLVRHVLKASAADNKTVTVRSVSSNHAALSLYRSMGFIPLREYPPVEGSLIIVELQLDTRSVQTETV